MPRPRARDANASRLASHPGWLWEVFEAAKAGTGYSRTFPGKNFATNARHRYHEFRRDCIYEGVPQAAIMTEMVCSMSKSEPWALTWTFIGNLADYVQAPSGREPLPQLTGAEGTQEPIQAGNIRPLGDQSASEKMVKAWLKKGKADNNPPQRPEMPSDLDIPALDLSPEGEQPPPCPPHEPSEVSDACIKCQQRIARCKYCKQYYAGPKCETCIST